MRRWISILLAVCAMMALCVPASAASSYNYTAQEKKDIERTLEMFHWYWYEYSGATALDVQDNNPIGIMRGLTTNPLCVDYSMYPVEQPQKFYTGSDPLHRWKGYYKTSEKSVEWVLKYMLCLNDAQIATLIARVDSGVDSGIYRYQGYYYADWPGVGGGYDVEISSVILDGNYYRVTYRAHGGEGYEDMGTRYAVFSRTAYEGKQYWSLRYIRKNKPASGMPFLDVMESDYYASPISWAYENGITAGTSDITFSPEAPCTRGQVVTFLWRASGSPAPKSSKNPFRDVPAGAYYTSAVLWAVEKGLTNGTTPTTFSPDDGCTRGQVVTFLHRLHGAPAAAGSNPFRDVPRGEYYYDAVLWAVGKGITNGTSATTFSPEATCTRGQIVTFLYRDLK